MAAIKIDAPRKNVCINEPPKVIKTKAAYHLGRGGSLPLCNFPPEPGGGVRLLIGDEICYVTLRLAVLDPPHCRYPSGSAWQLQVQARGRLCITAAATRCRGSAASLVIRFDGVSARPVRVRMPVRADFGA